MMEEGGSSIGSSPGEWLDVLRLARDEGSVETLSPEHFRCITEWCLRLQSEGGKGALLPPCLTELADILLYTLSVSTLTLEAQATASTAFASVLSLIQEPHSIVLLVSKTFLTVNDHLQVKLSKGSELSLSIAKPEVFKLCLIYGLLKIDSFWKTGLGSWEKLLKDKLFPILEKHCFEYSQLTVLSFKSLVLWCKRCETFSVPDLLSRLPPQPGVPPELLSRLAAIVISNWENPFNGVREQNAHILLHLLSFTESSEAAPLQLKPPALLHLVLSETSWMMKSKYFLLIALLPRCGIHKVLAESGDDIVAGLTSSLCFPHLAPAGTDLYRVCLESLSLDQWEQLFLKPIVLILLTSSCPNQKQNVFNYWVPCTIKKYKVSLQMLLEALVISGNNEDIILPVVNCLKIGRKEGYESMNWQVVSSSAHLLRALKHHDPQIRAHAFATICHSSKTSIVPTDDEFITVETFLSENINSDSTPLRQSILNSFTSFICRIRDACLHILKAKYQHEPQFENRALARSMVFLDWLYNFLKTNLEIGTNYQRKITSLELYKIVLNYLANENNSNQTSQRKSNLKQEGHRVMKYAIGVSKWGFTSDRSREILLYCISDQSEDVREIAAYILTNYFKMGESEGPRFAELYRKALLLSSDMMFYNADAGALLIYVLTSLAYKTGAGPKALEVKCDKVSECLLAVAEEQSIELRKDLLKATTSGSPLYGILQALRRLLTDPASPEYLGLDQSQQSRLNALVDETVHHLLQVLASKSTSITDYAPSFAEMGEEIENTIEESSVSVEESDKLQLSPAHQLVLNAIWLNLKACCWLSARVSGWENAVRVLRHCRHKGAVEAAGRALAMATKARPGDGELPLCQALDRLSAGQTQSSRGAGGVVLVHRLVASDTRPLKPMVEKALSHILSLVERKTGDLAQCLHILTVLVRDSSLSQDTARYLHRITPAAFACLSHSSWPVRNAALQLFGSIVPKLVGQRKQVEDDNSCSCYHLAYEELYFHSRGLVTLLVDSLEVATRQQDIVTHSRLVPLLTLLSNLSVGLLTIIDRSLESVFHRFVGSFQALMSSRVYKVRELAAKANAWFCSTSQIGSLIRTRVWKIVAYVNDPNLENEIKSENELHGFLLNTKFLLARFEEENGGMEVLRAQKQVVYESIEELKPIRNSRNISYVCRTLLSQLCGYDTERAASRQMEELLSIETPSHKDMGLPHWLSVNARQIIENCPLSDLLPTLNLVINSSNLELIDSCLIGLEKRVEKSEFEAVSNGTVNSLFRFVTSQKKARDINPALKVILEIISRYVISPINLNLDNLIESLLTEDSPEGLAVMCGLIQFRREIDIKLVRQVIRKLCESCKPTSKLEERRYGGRGLILLAPVMLESATEDCLDLRADLWTAAVTLLQDESPEVRYLASQFTNAITAKPHAGVLNPYSSLIFLHKESTMMSLFPMKQILRCLWRELRCTRHELAALEDAATIISPFENSTPNAYQEIVKIVEVSRDRLLALIRRDKEIGKILIQEEVLPRLKELREHCLLFISFSEEHTLRNPVLINREWYIVAKKLGTQFKIINSINSSGLDKDIEMFHYRFQSYLEHITFKG